LERLACRARQPARRIPRILTGAPMAAMRREKPGLGRQFALYDMPGRKGGYVVDVQANRLSHLDRRVVLPLLPADAKPPEIPSLNPTVEVGGKPHVLAPNLIASVRVAELGPPVGDLSNFQDEIWAAFDLLLKGF